MTTTDRSRERREEIEAILERKPGVREVRDEADRYTVVGAAGRGTYANWLTPVEEHFVCHRNAIPEIEDDSWSVAFSGGLAGEASVAELAERFPTVAVAHTMECAGNGRGQHEPETGSVQWGFEAAATAVWTGVPLSSVLRAFSEELPEEGWLTAVGGDPDEEGVFARSIPLEKAVDDCILAVGVNGRQIPAEHGYPVRLLVPGWYGVNSVKWLDELRLADSMVTEGSLDRPGRHARWQQEDYRIHPAGEAPEWMETIGTADTWGQLESDEVAHPYTFDQNVMSVIGTPDGEGSIRAGEIDVCGVAWAGDDSVERVEVSFTGGDEWTEAERFGPEYSGAWRLFRCSWNAEPGTHRLVSRATDEHGRTQPATIGSPEEGLDALGSGRYPWNEGGYAANAYLPNALEVRVEPDE
ncbi:molybdopterin-dependent oxidoreductase [Halalkalicoccus tibetensis]|uniref:Molybdopterin-dependent oxidoreductase n=1 Tax=Halalkalicoccus tibetensis TaxID=175632 RepID=A0ABD5UXP2_9EURY